MTRFCGLASIDELDYNAITVGFPVLAFGSILVAMGANYSPSPNTPQLAEGSIMPGGGRVTGRDSTAYKS